MFNNDTLGQAYLFYSIYVEEMNKTGKEPVGFLKFMIGKR